MLVFGSKLFDTPVMSLQTGGRLASITVPVIDPANLKIIAYEVDGPSIDIQPSFVRIDDVREIGAIGMIIDSNDELVGLDDVIKIRQIRESNFSLVGMPVLDQRRHKLGKIEDYTIETPSFVIQQLSVKRGLLKGLTDTGLLIHRSQIVEINDDAIIVKSTDKPVVEPTRQASRYEYVNPFRQNVPQPEEG